MSTHQGRWQQEPRCQGREERKTPCRLGDKIRFLEQEPIDMGPEEADVTSPD